MTKVPAPEPELDDQIRLEIQKQIQQEILPEIRKLFEENKAKAIAPTGDTTNLAEESDQAEKLDIEHPLIKESLELAMDQLPQVSNEEPILPMGNN